MKDKSLGPAVAVAWKGRIHWGWFVKFGGRQMRVLLVCGKTAGCSGPSIFSGSKVNCPGCLAKAKAHPGLIKGK